MFDISFLELTLVAVVALLVIGPDKLPELARTAGRWFGKTQRTLHRVKADIDRELASEELKKSLTGQDGEPSSPDLFEDVQQVAEEARCNFHLDASGQLQPPAPPATAAQSPERPN